MPASSAAAFALTIMIGLPVVAAVLVVRRRRLPRSIPGWAALFYLLNLIVNVPLVAFVWPAVLGRGSWAALVATCLTYGVCEELARWCSFRFVPTLGRHRDESGALAAGLGHGGAESVLFGLQLAAGLVLATALPGPGTLVLSGIDRIPALVTHVAFAFLVVLAFRVRRRFLFVAMLVHAGTDLLVFGIQRAVPGPFFEVVFDVVAVGALLFIATVTRRRLLAPEGSSGGRDEQRPDRFSGESAESDDAAAPATTRTTDAHPEPAPAP